MELVGSVMEEMRNSQGPRADAIAAHYREFMLAIKKAGVRLDAMQQNIEQIFHGA